MSGALASGMYPDWGWLCSKWSGFEKGVRSKN